MNLLAQSNEINLTPSPQPPKNTTKLIVAIIFFLLLSSVSTFASGYFVSTYLNPRTVTTINSAVPPKPVVPNPIDPTTTSPFVTAVDFYKLGPAYFEDTIIAVSKSSSKSVIASAVRQEKGENEFIQGTRLSFNDGEQWQRHIDSTLTDTSEITSNQLIKNWKLSISESRLLNEKSDIEFAFGGSEIQLTTSVLSNEVVLRSFPWDTKFMSTGSGELTINGAKEEVLVAYVRRYSTNHTELQFVDTSLSATTDWIIFWDTAGNFYHIDATDVQNPNEKYASHTLAAKVDPDKSVFKTFEIGVARDNDTNPTSYAVTLGHPINSALSFTRSTTLDKAPNSDITDIIGNISGTVTLKSGEKLEGFGIAEYLKD